MAFFSYLFGAAQTNVTLVHAKPTERITLRRLEAMCDNANTVDVGVSFSMGTVPNVFSGHPGIAAGSGYVVNFKPGDAEGQLGDDLIFSCEVPTGGGIRVSGSYDLNQFQNPSQ